jgi:hypothetical protein
MVTSYYGMTWWDNETDGDLMYPKEQPDLRPRSSMRFRLAIRKALRCAAKWGQDRDFLQSIWTDVNPKAKRTSVR